MNFLRSFIAGNETRAIVDNRNTIVGN